MADDTDIAEPQETVTALQPASIPEPAPIKTPSTPKPVSAAKGIVQPMEYHTEITQRVAPITHESNGNSYPSAQSDLSHINKKDRATVQLINRISNENMRDHRIEISRLYPQPVGPVETPPGGFGCYDDMVMILGKAFGHGGYKVRIFRNELFLPMYQMTIDIAEKSEPTQIINGNGHSIHEEDEEFQLKKQQRISEQRIRTKKTIAELEKAERQIEEEKEKRAMQPMELMQAQFKQQIELMQAQLKAAQEANNAKKGPDILEIITALGPVLTAILNKPVAPPPQSNDGMLKEVVQLMMKSNEQVMNVALEAAKKKDDKGSEFKEIAMMLIEKRVNQGEDQLKTMLDMMERGREQAREMFELSRGDDDIDIDPNNVWGSLIAQGVKGLVHMFRHGGPQIAAILADKLGKPVSSVTEQDLAALAEQLKSVPSAQKPIAQLPLPPLRPSAPVVSQVKPSPNVVKMPPPAMFNPATHAGFVPATTTTPAPTLTTTGSGTSDVVINKEEAGLTEVDSAAQQAPPPVETHPAEPSSVVAADLNDPVEKDLREFVDAAIAEYMLTDLKAERSEHEWPFFAAAKWSKAFKDQIVATGADHMAKIKLIESKATPALWRQVEAELPKGRNWEYLQWALTALMTEINNPSPPAVEQPVQAPPAQAVSQ